MTFTAQPLTMKLCCTTALVAMFIGGCAVANEDSVRSSDGERNAKPVTELVAATDAEVLVDRLKVEALCEDEGYEFSSPFEYAAAIDQWYQLESIVDPSEVEALVGEPDLNSNIDLAVVALPGGDAIDTIDVRMHSTSQTALLSASKIDADAMIGVQGGGASIVAVFSETDVVFAGRCMNSWFQPALSGRLGARLRQEVLDWPKYTVDDRLQRLGVAEQTPPATVEPQLLPGLGADAGDVRGLVELRALMGWSDALRGDGVICLRSDKGWGECVGLADPSVVADDPMVAYGTEASNLEVHLVDQETDESQLLGTIDAERFTGGRVPSVQLDGEFDGLVKSIIAPRLTIE